MRDEKEINWVSRGGDKWKSISIGEGETYKLLASVDQEVEDSRVCNPGKWFASVLSSDEVPVGAPIFDKEVDATSFAEAMFLLDWSSQVWDRVLLDCQRDDRMGYQLFVGKDRQTIVKLLQVREASDGKMPITNWDVEIYGDIDQAFFALLATDRSCD